jgi:hypothetical protein
LQQESLPGPAVSLIQSQQSHSRHRTLCQAHFQKLCTTAFSREEALSSTQQEGAHAEELVRETLAF